MRRIYRHTQEETIEESDYDGTQDFVVVVDDEEKHTLKRVRVGELVPPPVNSDYFLLRDVSAAQVIQSSLNVATNAILSGNEVTIANIAVTGYTYANSPGTTVEATETMTTSSLSGSTVTLSNNLTSATCYVTSSGSLQSNAITVNPSVKWTENMLLHHTAAITYNNGTQSSVVSADGFKTCEILLFEDAVDEEIVPLQSLYEAVLSSSGGTLEGPLTVNTLGAAIFTNECEFTEYATRTVENEDLISKYDLDEALASTDLPLPKTLFELRLIPTTNQSTFNGINYDVHPGYMWLAKSNGRPWLYIFSGKFTELWRFACPLPVVNPVKTIVPLSGPRVMYFAYSYSPTNAVLPPISYYESGNPSRIGVVSEGWLSAAMAVDGAPWYTTDSGFTTSWPWLGNYSGASPTPTYNNEWGHTVLVFFRTGECTSCDATTTTPLITAPVAPPFPTSLVFIYAWRFMPLTGFEYRVLLWNVSLSAREYESEWTQYDATGVSPFNKARGGGQTLYPYIRGTGSSAGTNEQRTDWIVGASKLTAVSFSDLPLSQCCNVFRELVP